MTLGYCLVCDRLVPIVSGDFKNNGTVPPQRWWRPVYHNDNDGFPCPGMKRPI